MTFTILALVDVDLQSANFLIKLPDINLQCCDNISQLEMCVVIKMQLKKEMCFWVCLREPHAPAIVSAWLLVFFSFHCFLWPWANNLYQCGSVPDAVHSSIVISFVGILEAWQRLLAAVIVMTILKLIIAMAVCLYTKLQAASIAVCLLSVCLAWALHRGIGMRLLLVSTCVCAHVCVRACMSVHVCMCVFVDKKERETAREQWRPNNEHDRWAPVSVELLSWLWSHGDQPPWCLAQTIYACSEFLVWSPHLDRNCLYCPLTVTRYCMVTVWQAFLVKSTLLASLQSFWGRTCHVMSSSCLNVASCLICLVCLSQIWPPELRAMQPICLFVFVFERPLLPHLSP